MTIQNQSVANVIGQISHILAIAELNFHSFHINTNYLSLHAHLFIKALPFFWQKKIFLLSCKNVFSRLSRVSILFFINLSILHFLKKKAAKLQYLLFITF